MSKGLSYFLGILTGIILTLGFFVVKNYLSKPSGEKKDNTEKTEKQEKLPRGVAMLDEPIPFTEARDFRIMQVVFEDAALAQSKRQLRGSGSYYSDPLVLIVSDQANTFYDDQIITAPKDCKVMQVGTYKYNSQLGWKTVPIIRFIKSK